MRRPIVIVVVVVIAACGVGITLTAPRDSAERWNVPLTLAFADDFEGERLDDVWNTCHWWADDGCTIASNNELQWYQPAQVSVSDGVLSLVAEPRRVEGDDGAVFPFVSGMVTTGPPSDDTASRFDFTYGRVAARFRTPEGRGLWSALWLLPSTTESRPEIDAVEILGDDPAEWIFHLHPEDRDADSPGERVRGPDTSGDWHEVGIDWAPGRLRWSVDGDPVWEVSGDEVPDEPMYLVANLAVGGDYPGPPSEDTAFPARLEIDWIRVWRRSA